MSEEVAASTSQSVVANSVQDVDCLQFCEYTFKSHHALCDITENTLNDILSADAFLNDIPYDITNEEVQSQIAVVKGQSITIYVKREPYSKFKIVIPETHTTVLDLKTAIKQNYELNQKRLANRERRSKCTAKHQQEQQRPHKQTPNRRSHSTHSTVRGHAGHKLMKISWRYIWRTYYLEFDGDPLTDDRQILAHYGIRNKSVLRFVKKVKHLRRH